MKVNLVIGIICLLTSVSLSGVAGVYAATNTSAALGVALASCIALLIGVKSVAGSR
jgi:hypothetical protein